MKKLLLFLFILVSVSAIGQRQYKDTVMAGMCIRVSWATTSQSEVIFFTPGLGQVGNGTLTDTQYIAQYGPEYWLKNGWDGTVALGNGTHTPVLVTIIQSVAINGSGYSTPPQIKPALTALIASRFHPFMKDSAWHCAGFSAGGWIWSMFNAYQGTATDTTYYSYFKSEVDIEGVVPSDVLGTGTTIAYPMRFGHRETKKRFRFLGFEQINDTRDVWNIRKNINDSLPTNAWFAWSHFGAGGHSNFNDFLNPSTTDWTATNTNLNTTANGQTSNFIATGQNVFQWMLRQGDTTLANPALTANAGTNFDYPDSIPYITLNGSASGGTPPYTYLWTVVQRQNSNPWNAMILDPTKATTVVNWVGLFNAINSTTYTYNLQVTDNFGVTANSQIVTHSLYRRPNPHVGTGWHYATATDVTNIPNANLNDVIIDGANTDNYGVGSKPVDIYFDFTAGGGFHLNPGQKILIDSGNYMNIKIFPNKDSIHCADNNKCIVTNYNGGVVTEQLQVGASTNISWDFRYSAANKTGHPSFPGHAGGYAFSSGKYGLFINNGYRSPDEFLISAASSDSMRGMEFHGIELGNGGFAWVLGKLSTFPTFDYVTIDNCYLHDTHGEGAYWGRTSADQPILHHWKITNNRFVRTGNEAFQMVNIGTDDTVTNNVMYMSAMNWMSTFDYDQDFNFQWGLAEGGRNYVRGNIILGSGEQNINYIEHTHTGGSTTGVLDTWTNNLFGQTRGPAMNFIGDQTAGNWNAKFDSSYFQFARWKLYRIFNTSTSRGTNTNDNFRVQQNVAPVDTYTMSNNFYDSTKTNFVSISTGITQINNTQVTSPHVFFVNSGWNDTAFIGNVSMYADTVFWMDHSENPSMGAASNQYQRIAYDSLEYVFFQGKCFQSKKSSNTASLMGITDANWQLITWARPDASISYLPPDDLRLAKTSKYGLLGIGLQDQLIVPPSGPGCCIVVPHGRKIIFKKLPGN